MKDLIKEPNKVLSADSGRARLPAGPADAAGPSAAVNRGPGGIMRLGWIVILVGLIGFGVWAGQAPLDSGAVAPGTIVVDSQRMRVQHLTGGIVDEILVRDGDSVTQGQVMVRLNRTQIQAELGIVRSQWLTALAVEARLQAEQSDNDHIVWPEAVLQHQEESRIAGMLRTQQQLFTTRRGGLRNELAILEENARGVREQISGLDAQQRGKRRQLALLQEEQDSLSVLFDEGFVPRNRIFELERAIAETESNLSEIAAAMGRARATLAEVQLNKIQREQAYVKEVDTLLTEVQREVDGLTERMIALTDQLERIEVRAPVAGVVVNRQVHSINGVIRPGEDILEIVPDGEPLIIEAMVPPQSIELITPGLSTLVRFSTLGMMNPVVNGDVLMVSADRLTDQRTGMDYFLARIAVPPEEMEKLTFERIVPGMPVEVIIRTGEHSLLHYLLKPVFDNLFTAFRED